MGIDQFGNYIDDGQDQTGQYPPTMPFLNPGMYTPVTPPQAPGPGGRYDASTTVNRISGLQSQLDKLTGQQYSYPDAPNLQHLPAPYAPDVKGIQHRQSQGSLLSLLGGLLLGGASGAGGLRGAGAAASGFTPGFEQQSQQSQQEQSQAVQAARQQVLDHNALLSQRFGNKLTTVDKARNRDIGTANVLRGELGTENRTLGSIRTANNGADRTAALGQIAAARAGNQFLNTLMSGGDSAIAALQSLSPDQLKAYNMTPEERDALIASPIVRQAKRLPPEVIAKIQAQTQKTSEEARKAGVQANFEPQYIQSQIGNNNASVTLKGAQTGQANANTGLIGTKETGQEITNKYIAPKAQAEIDRIHSAIKKDASYIDNNDWKQDFARANQEFNQGMGVIKFQGRLTDIIARIQGNVSTQRNRLAMLHMPPDQIEQNMQEYEQQAKQAIRQLNDEYARSSSIATPSPNNEAVPDDSSSSGFGDIRQMDSGIKSLPSLGNTAGAGVTPPKVTPNPAKRVSPDIGPISRLSPEQMAAFNKDGVKALLPGGVAAPKATLKQTATPPTKGKLGKYSFVRP